MSLDLFFRLSPSERILTVLLGLEVLVIIMAVVFLAVMRQRNQMREARLDRVRIDLGAWFADALLTPPDPTPCAVDILLRAQPVRDARLLLVELGEQVGVEDRRIVAARLEALKLTGLLQIGLLRKRDHLFLVREARALGDPGDVLTKLVRESDPSVCVGAFEGLCELQRAPEALAELNRIAKMGPTARARLVDTLGQTRPSPVEMLVGIIQGGVPEATQVALDALGQAQDLKTRPVLIQCLTHDNSEIRMRALRSLRALGDPASAENARLLLADPIWQVRSEAVRACATLGGEEAARWIAPLLHDDAEWVRHHTAFSLLQCKGAGTEVLDAGALAGNRAAQSALAQMRLIEANT